MALLNKLKDIRTTKQTYFVMQHKFYGELTKRYPYLMKRDMANIANELEKELQLMLCVSLKFESIKIKLPAVQKYTGDTDFINVQRGEPGFYYPQSTRGTSDLHYMDLRLYLSDNDNLRNKYVQVDYSATPEKKTKVDERHVELSALRKKGKRVHQDKLDFYFKILREVMAYRKKFLCYTEAGYDHEIALEFKTDNLAFSLLDKSMNIILAKEYEKDRNNGYKTTCNFRYRETKADLFRLLDYSDSGSHNFGPASHIVLKAFIKDYKEIRANLDAEEKKKRLAYNQCQSFIGQLRVHTLPFKVLGELKK